MIYRVPQEWMERQRKTARLAAIVAAALGIGVLLVGLVPHIRWSSKDVTAAVATGGLIAVGLFLALMVGRFKFRSTMRRWESFSIELTPSELVRQMDGRETRILRANVASIREFPRRGFVVTDKNGWRIYVPRIVEGYRDFRETILKWMA